MRLTKDNLNHLKTIFPAAVLTDITDVSIKGHRALKIEVPDGRNPSLSSLKKMSDYLNMRDPLVAIERTALILYTFDDKESD